MSFHLVRNDIVKMKTQAIVNTANEDPIVGEGCDYAIYMAAGYNKLLDYRREHIGHVPEGEVFITPGFGLAAEYIIHAVSPFFMDDDPGVEDRLRSCYRRSLALAAEHDITSIAFPLISTGSFGYPKEEGLRIAVDEIYEFLFDHEMEVYLVVFDEHATRLGRQIYPDLQTYIDVHYVEERSSREELSDENMPEELSSEKAGAEKPGAEEPGENKPAAEKPEYPQPKSVSKETARPRGRRRRDERIDRRDEHVRLRNVRPDAHQPERPTPRKNSRQEAFGRYDVHANKLIISSVPSDGFDVDDMDDWEELKRKLDERKAHLADTFSQYLLYLIASRGMTNVEVYKRACVSKKLFAKIKNDVTYHPTKITCLCLCVGARLNLDDTRDLLARAGYALSPCDMTDVIFSYFIEKNHFDLLDIDIQLEEYGLPCVIE